MFSDKEKKYRLDYTPDINIPSRVMPYILMIIKRNPVMWCVFILADIVHGLRYPITFLIMGMTIDSLPDNNFHDTPDRVWFYTGIIFVVLFLGEAAHLITHYFTFDWWKRARAELRSDLFAYTLQHSFSYFQNHFAGSLARKISEGIEKALVLNEQIRWQLLLPFVVMMTTALFLIQVSLLYSMIVFLFIFLIVFPVVGKLEKLRKKSKIFADSCSNVSGQIVDSLTNIASVKSYAHESLELAEHRKISEEQMKAWHKMLRVFLLLDNYRRMTIVLLGSGMMTACVIGWKNGIISTGDFATIMGLSLNLTATAWHLSNGIIRTMESIGYLNDSLATIIQPHSVKDQDDAHFLTVQKGRITFRDITFEYENQNVFDRLNLCIDAGQRVGLVGHSGAGKTTLINLLQRLFDIQGGEICIDGRNIAEVTQQSLRHSIAVIPQDTALFHRTIMENIRYGRLEASDEDVIEAAKRAHALDFIENLPAGFDTMVGERGVKLSGGQRQRIAIARAILKDAPILILDEATSALDSESEREIQAALEDLMQGKTVIAVAHRLSTIHNLDRLLVMDQGQIIEDGTHYDLLVKKGLYHRLWSMQSGGFLKE